MGRDSEGGMMAFCSCCWWSGGERCEVGRVGKWEG